MMTARNDSRRPGAILIKFVILLPVLFAWVGLVIDTGMLLATRRQAQNAADAAALAAAMDLFRAQKQGITLGPGLQPTLQATAELYAERNGMDRSTVTVNYEPTVTAITAFQDYNYVEVIITKPLKTWFIQVVGANPEQQVVARAVAGLEAIENRDLLVVLDPSAVPGLAVSGTASLRVEGTIRVNSTGGGVDANGDAVNSNNGVAISAGPSGIYAERISSVGGVDKPSRLRSVTDGTVLGPGLFKAGEPPWPDPYAGLPPVITPYVNPTFRGDASPNTSTNTTLQPGIYSSIKITGGGSGTVTFAPGIYVIRPARNEQNPLLINNSGGRVIGDGVMFYNTGTNYSPTTGDAGAGDHYGGVIINSSNLTLTPLNDTTNPFNGFVYYQSRSNSETFDVQSGGAGVSISGAIYAKVGHVKLAGQAMSFNSPFVVGSLTVTGDATLHVPAAGVISKTYLVYLVE